MLRLLIIGIGHPLRSDDGVGFYIASEFSREPLPDGVQVLAVQQLTPELSELSSRVEHVLFVDAARTGPPGSVKCEPVVPATVSSRHSHELTPAGMIQMAQALYGRCPTAHLLTVAGESFADGDTLSATVTAALPALKAQIAEFIDKSRKKENS